MNVLIYRLNVLAVVVLLFIGAELALNDVQKSNFGFRQYNDNESRSTALYLKKDAQVNEPGITEFYFDRYQVMGFSGKFLNQFSRQVNVYIESRMLISIALNMLITLIALGGALLTLQRI